MNRLQYLIPALFLFSGFGCVKAPDFPNTPVLIYNTAEGDGFNQDTIIQGRQGNISDTLILTFSFTDGDGDIGFERDSFDVFFIDSRVPSFEDNRRLPVIPDEGIGNGIEGKIILRFPNQPTAICCLNNGTVCGTNPNPVDTFSYTLQIRDRAGNLSNRIQTETVTIRCD